MLGPLEELLVRSATQEVVLTERRELELIHRNGLRMLKLVNTLLDFSRIEAGRINATYKSTDLAAFTAELASSFRSAMDRAGLQFTVDCPALPVPVYVDRDMWEKIVLNLLSNAFKYTLEGEVSVAVRPSPHGDAAEVVVRDTGVGIPAHELQRIFERFHRIEGQRGRTHEGTGIGLALVQELVKLHGGSVTAESAPGQGTAFTVTIPVGQAHLPPNRTDAPRAQVSTGIGAEAFVEEALRWLPGSEAVEAEVERELFAPEPEALATGERSRVLLADDNRDLREYVARLLGSRYQVEAVPDGRAALEAAGRRRPDLVLTDVMMPRLDGFGLLRALREDPELRDVPVILLSARAGEEARVEGLEAGADDYLTKPFTARELVARVDTNLQLARTRREAALRERALRAEAEAMRRRFETVVEHLPFGIVVADPDGRVVLTNPALERVLGHKPIPTENVAAFARWHLLRPDGSVVPPNEYPLARALRGELVRNAEFLYGHGDETVRWIRVSGIPVRDASGGIVTAIAVAADVDLEKRSQIALREFRATLEQRVEERTSQLVASQALLRTLYEHSSECHALLVAVEGDRFRYEEVNPATLRLYRMTREQVVGRTVDEVFGPVRAAEVNRYLTACLRSGGPYRYERMVDGSIVEAVAAPVPAEAGQPRRLVVTARDVTERRRLEDQLRQAQKMEAVGQLTGGVAHDFNNLLQVILGSLELLRRRSVGGSVAPDEFRRLTESAMRGAQRAATLTHRLLAFSRRQPLDPKPLDLNRLVSGMSDLLRRTLGESITIESVLAGGLWRVSADANQLENALLNLAVNARDAMPDGGKLTIEAANVFLDEAYAATEHEVTPGQYVLLAVSDTGTGMTREVMAKAFEPFFTTKDIGQGTGLGLSQVFGFVKQSGGHLKIYSELGEGTTVKLYLPRLLGGAAADGEPLGAEPVIVAGPGETILVVEDDPDVRANTASMLRELGYAVLEAEDGHAALHLLERHAEVRLLFTDIGLPGGLNGRQLAEKARRRRAGLKVLFTTGYARNAITHHGRLDPGVELLVKPFTYASLASKIRSQMRGEATRGEPM